MEPYFMFSNWCWIPIIFCLIFMFGFGRRRNFGPWGMMNRREENNFEKGSEASALEVLNTRYAKGEISREEYLDMKKTLMS